MKELPPIPTAFTSVIASREFVIVRKGISAKTLFEVSLPIQDVETVAGFDWRCPIRVTEGVLQRDQQAYGVDSLQALQLGLKVIADEVEAMSRAGGRVQLFGEPYDGSV